MAPSTIVATNRAHLAAPLAAVMMAGAAAVLSYLTPAGALVLLALLGARASIFRTAPISPLSIAAPMAAALLAGASMGVAGGIGALFAWRLIADTQWSLRQARAIASTTTDLRPRARLGGELHAWLTPLFGLALMAYTAPHMVAGLPLDLPHPPFWAPLLLGIAAAVAVFDWLLRRAAEWRLGEIDKPAALHFVCHHGLFLAAFGLGLDVSAGIVALVAWRLAHAAPPPTWPRQLSFTAVP